VLSFLQISHVNDIQLKYDLVFFLSHPHWDEYQLADHFLAHLSQAFNWEVCVSITHRYENVDYYSEEIIYHLDRIS